MGAEMQGYRAQAAVVLYVQFFLEMHQIARTAEASITAKTAKAEATMRKTHGTLGALRRQIRLALAERQMLDLVRTRPRRTNARAASSSAASSSAAVAGPASVAAFVASVASHAAPPAV